MRPEQRLVSWLDTISELLAQPLTAVPTATLEAALFETFEVSAVSWNWRDDEASFGYTVTAEPGRRLADPARQQQFTPQDLARHPLVQWFQVTGDQRAVRISDVPFTVTCRADRDATLELLRPLDSERQLSIPYALDGTRYRAFVLCRSGSDFSSDDVAVARRLQPLLRAIDQQATVLSSWAPEPLADIRQCPLSGREVAVLRLVAEGATALRIGRRLGISPRTVHKHLEHIYRKLEVSDRLSAVRVATRLGYVPHPCPPWRQGPALADWSTAPWSSAQQRSAR